MDQEFSSSFNQLLKKNFLTQSKMTTPTTSIFHRRFNTLNRSAIHTKLVVATDPKRCTK